MTTPNHTPPANYAQAINAAATAIVTGTSDACVAHVREGFGPDIGPSILMVALTPEQSARLTALTDGPNMPASFDPRRAEPAVFAARDAARVAFTKALNMALAAKAPLPDYGDPPAAEVDDGPGLDDNHGFRFVPSLSTAEPTACTYAEHRPAMVALEERGLAWGGTKVACDTIIGQMDGGDDLVKVVVSTEIKPFGHTPFEMFVFVDKLVDDAGVLNEGRSIPVSGLVAEGVTECATGCRAWTMPRAQANHAEALRYWHGRMGYDKDAADRFFNSHRDSVEHFNVRDLAGAEAYPTEDDETRNTLTTREPKP